MKHSGISYFLPFHVKQSIFASFFSFNPCKHLPALL